MIRYIVTSPLSLARLLWWYGEDDLCWRAARLSPAQVADLAPVFARLRADPAEVARVWRNAPRHDAHLLLPVIELLEGRARPPARRHRRTDAAMPSVLAIEDEKRWLDPQLEEVARLVDRRTGVAWRPDVPADQPRLQGRWAPW